MTLTVPLKKLDPAVQVPAYAHAGDSGLDLQANEDAELAPFERKLIGCGFSMALPEGYGGFVLPRSGLASKHGITVVNAPGLIDSNYRGEVKVALVNMDPHERFCVSRGDRIAQLVIMATPEVQMQEVDDLDETERGSGGFGSSGIKEN